MSASVASISLGKLRKRYRNRVRLATALFFFGMGFSFATWASRIPSIKSQLQLTEADLGSLLLALPVGQLLAMTFSGKVVTRYGSRWICALGLLLYAGCLPLISVSHSKWELAVALTLFGFFGNLCNIAVNTQGVYTQFFFEKPILGSFHGSWSLAGFAGALTGLVMLSFHMSVFYHFLIALGFVSIIVVTNTKYLVKTQSPKRDEESSYNFLKNPDKTLLWLGIICFFGMASEGIMFDWSGVYFKEIVEAPGAFVVLGYTSFMISMASGRFLSDFFVARLGNKKVLIYSGLIIFIGLYTAVLFPYLIPSTLAFMLVGIGVSNVIPIIFNAAGNHPTIPTGMALTIVTSISFLGFMIGPPIIGYIAELTNLRYSFAVIGVFGLIIALLVQRLSLFKG